MCHNLFNQFPIMVILIVARVFLVCLLGVLILLLQLTLQEYLCTYVTESKLVLLATHQADELEMKC